MASDNDPKKPGTPADVFDAFGPVKGEPEEPTAVMNPPGGATAPPPVTTPDPFSAVVIPLGDADVLQGDITETFRALEEPPPGPPEPRPPTPVLPFETAADAATEVRSPPRLERIDTPVTSPTPLPGSPDTEVSLPEIPTFSVAKPPPAKRPPPLDPEEVTAEIPRQALTPSPAAPPTNPNTEVGRILPDRIYRFRRSERMLHWCIAVPFLVCIASAAVLFFVYNKNPLLPYRPVFSWIHRIAGAGLIALPPLAILLNVRDLRVHLINIREGWSWSLDDLKWLALSPLAIIKKGVKLPEEGKFNAGEKLNFMSSMGSWLVLGTTGVLLWLEPLTLGAWLIHLATTAAVLPLVGGHIFMATINPASRVGLSGMLNGWVDREWAAHHYRRWYGQMIARHLALHGKVPELDTVEYDEAPTPTDVRRIRLARIRWFAMGSTIGLVVAVVVGGATFALRAWLPQPALGPLPPVTMFVEEEQTLLTRPADGATPVRGEPLRRGAQVTRIAELGDYALVQDHQARAGYVKKAALAMTAPRVAPGVEFADCAPAAADTDAQPCEARAKGLLESCVTNCPESRKAVCAEICEDRFSTCMDSCRKPFAGIDAGRVVKTEAPVDAGAAAASEVLAPVPVKAPVKPPKRPVKKR